ncbi:MAG: hypothetical protein JOZ40_01895 [Methylobacteriaceae bacterium]|nr:hypothetical protein [Methylobacteriaceae bacterium]
MSEVVVFTGPTIGHETARALAPFDYRAPFQRGDVYRAVLEEPRVIAIIDGYFEGVPAVLHKEILFALSRGIHVFGAASMGALRAAELAPFGMRGVGRIAAWYCDGTIEDDDEVAVVHGPAETGFVPLSVPMVNVRATVEHAVDVGVLPASAGAAVLLVARQIFYKERTWEQVLAGCRDALAKNASANFAKWQPSGSVDLKREDAEALIATLAGFVESTPGPFRPHFEFEPTDAWEEAVAAFDAASEQIGGHDLILDEVRLEPDLYIEIARAAALRLLAAPGPEPCASPTVDARRISRFRAERGLLTREEFSGWLTRNALSEAALDRLLSQVESETAALGGLGRRLSHSMLDELKLRGVHERLARQAERKASFLAGEAGHRAGSRLPAPPVLVHWYFEERLGRPVPEDLDGFLGALGIAGRPDFHELLVREYLFATMHNCRALRES